MNFLSPLDAHKGGLMRLSLLASLICVSAALLAPMARGAADEYGIERVGASLSTLEAGRHPDLNTEIDISPQPTQPVTATESLKVQLPNGLLSNRQNFEECDVAHFIDFTEHPCPQDSQIGVVSFKLGFAPNDQPYHEPLYNLTTRGSEFIRLGFIGFLFPIFLEASLRSDSDYGVTIGPPLITSAIPISKIHTTAWGVPADPIHDTERLTPFEAAVCNFFGEGDVPCLTPEHKRESEAVPTPFMSNPVNCGPLPFDFETTTYLLPGRVFSSSTDQQEITDCDKVPFEPSLTFATTSRKAGAPTGLETTLTIPQNEGTETVNSSPVKSAKVVLPEGMTVNSSAADGLGSCSVEQANLGKRGPGNCPNDSKIGSVNIISPSLEREIEGGLYLRTPEPGHLIRFWLIANELGLDIKVPAEVEPDPSTGRLTVVFPNAPQLPTEVLTMHFNSGPRAALKNPDKCGAYAANYELNPWSGNPPVIGSSAIEVTEGCNTGGFAPKLSAGTMDPTAGRFSPFVFDLSREDGEQNVASVDVNLPEGLTAKFAGVQTCPEGAAASGNCPVSSQIGIVKAAVGAGALPLWVPQPGKEATAAYLGGPYKGAPYSLIAKVPAQAGPFDLGTVVVRSAIEVDPETAKGSVSSDPLPQVLEGIPVSYRHVRVEANRPSFTLNPTSCEPKQVSAQVRSSQGAVASPSDRFQAVECAKLGFKPRLAMSLFGPTTRGGHPAFHAVLKAPPGQANLKAASVALPRSEFLDQGHIGTVCTRVQFAAHTCPARSIYGEVQATTPLLEEPLKGNVYLRSSNHKLPDMVLALKGPNGLEVATAARIDSVRGGIRASFEAIPDVPVTKVVLDMSGGKQGLLQNSTNICTRPFKATAAFDAQNGRIHDIQPVLRPGCKVSHRRSR